MAVRSHQPVCTACRLRTGTTFAQLHAGGAFDTEFHAAWENGRAFLAAEDGLRGRLPNVVEWKGTGRALGDEVAPIDLRVDHVYLVSCKYLSDILFNASPSHVFDDLLVGAHGSRSGREKRLAGDWYAEVAPAEYEVLYAEVRRATLDWDRAALASTAATIRPRSSVSGTTGGVVPLPGLDGDGAGTGRGAVRRNTGGPPAVLRSLPAQAAQLSSEQREALGHVAASGVARVHQGALRPVVRSRGQPRRSRRCGARH